MGLILPGKALQIPPTFLGSLRMVPSFWLTPFKADPSSEPLVGRPPVARKGPGATRAHVIRPWQRVGGGQARGRPWQPLIPRAVTPSHGAGSARPSRSYPALCGQRAVRGSLGAKGQRQGEVEGSGMLRERATTRTCTRAQHARVRNRAHALVRCDYAR